MVTESLFKFQGCSGLGCLDVFFADLDLPMP